MSRLYGRILSSLIEKVKEISERERAEQILESRPELENADNIFCLKRNEEVIKENTARNAI